jgi:hypothetical protein
MEANAMAANLVSLIMQFITPSMISKMATTLGLDRDEAQKAIGVSVPAILAGFANAATKPDGGQKLSNALAQQSGFLDQMKTAIGSGGEKALADNGAGLLSSLLGGGAMSALSGAVGRYAGIDANSSKSLLGFLGPIVAGVVGQQQSSAGLDAKGLTNLLMSQKDQIAAAMPSGFASLLGGTGLLDGLGDTWLRGSAAASSAAGRASDMSGYAAANAANTARATTNVWPWALGIIALAGLGWFFLGRDTSQIVAERPAPVTRSGDTMGAGAPDARLTDLTAELTSSVSAVRSALQGMTDPASAQAALPKLAQATAQFDTIGDAASQLPPNARREIASYVERSMPMLNQLCDKVLATPQTAALAKPAIDALRAKLAALSRS